MDFAFMQAMSPKNETGGFIQYQERDNLVIAQRLHWCNSTANGAHRSVTAGRIAQFYSDMWETYQIHPRHLMGVCHTHPGFGVFWSATDVKEGIQDVLENVGQSLYSLVISEIGVAKARYDVKTGVNTVSSESLDVEWNIPVIYKGIVDEFSKSKALAPQPVNTPQITSYGNWRGSYGQYPYYHPNQDGVGRAGNNTQLEIWKEESYE